MKQLLPNGNWGWVAAAVFLIVGHLAINILSARLDACQSARDLALSQVETLSAQVEEQNNAVLALEAAATQNREIYLAGLEAANRKAVRLEIQAEDYLNLSTPSDPAEACEVADQILTEVTR
jgi:hypothetical protein